MLLAFDHTESAEIETLASQAGVGFTPVGQVTDQEQMKVKQGGAIVLQAKVSDLKKRWQDKWKPFFNEG